jgi:hypothetical protein
MAHSNNPPPPATGYQWLTLLIRVIAEHASVDPPLTTLSRALGKTDSFAHEVLRQLLRRTSPPHGRRPACAVSSRIVFRWFLDRGDPQHPGDARERLRVLMDARRDPMEALEMLVCFHFAMGSCEAAARVDLVGDVLAKVQSEADVVRRKRLKGLLQHAIVDYAMNLEEMLGAEATVRAFDAADLVYNAATSVEAAGAPRAGVIAMLEDLRPRSIEAFGLATYALVARLGALPGLAQSARSYLEYLEDQHAEALRDLPRLALAEHAAQFDHSEDLAAVLRGRSEPAIDLLALLEQALSVVGRGALRRRRRDERARTRWKADEVRRVVRRFQAWAFTHDCCRMLAPLFDARARPTNLTRDVGKLATWATREPLDSAIGAMLTRDLYVIE